jgi:hypothetical protein
MRSSGASTRRHDRRSKPASKGGKGLRARQDKVS